MEISSQLSPPTVATFQRLVDADWFCNLGGDVEDATKTRVLGSWDEAIKHCSSLDWSNLCLEAANDIRVYLLNHARSRYVRWNEVVGLVKPACLELVRLKTDKVIRRNSLPKEFIDRVNWDILHLLLEAEYSDVYQPCFYAALGYWYVTGRFPCGWEGKHPAGRLIVY